MTGTAAGNDKTVSHRDVSMSGTAAGNDKMAGRRKGPTYGTFNNSRGKSDTRASRSKDESLIPILERIVRKGEYSSYFYFTGYSSPSKLGETARRAIQTIRKNIENDPV